MRVAIIALSVLSLAGCAACAPRAADPLQLDRNILTVDNRSSSDWSDVEIVCPCCSATLVIDTNLGRIVSHKEPENPNKPELSEAQRILAEEAARREAIFQQSVESEKTRGDALARRFEEALKQARQEPVTKPTRDFDLD